MRRKAFGIIETLIALFLSGLIFYIAFAGVDSVVKNYNKVKEYYLKKLNLESALQIYLSGREPPEELNGQRIDFSEEELKIKLKEGE
ncbi:MAG: hypothetical protein J7L34_06320 [Thermotogaceae bacterium]|nr:hypothetical protein [Thermotogaceae bacterium]